MRNCTIPNGPIQANADIAGNGVSSLKMYPTYLADTDVQVVVAFIVWAAMTIVAVVYAYLSDSIHQAYLTESDEKFIGTFQDLCARATKTSIGIWCGLCWRTLAGVVLRRKENSSRPVLSREARQQAITRFILVLSDQQLAVGLAILIAAVANQDSISTYEFRIAFALAWFSSTTHLATLDGLRHYFQHHQTLRNWRVSGVAIFLGLFFYSFGMILFSMRFSGKVPVTCIFEPNARWAPSGSVSQAFTLVFAWFVTSLVLLLGYKDRILQSYGLSTTGFYGPGIITTKIRLLTYRLSRSTPKELYTASLHEWKYILQEAALEEWAETQQCILNRLEKSKNQATDLSLRQILRYVTSLVLLLRHLYRRSLFRIFPLLSFMVTYGLMQMVNYRWTFHDVKIVNEMGFGQIMPLFLLVLPIFAAAEIYHGE
jgi:hypothetical protein